MACCSRCLLYDCTDEPRLELLGSSFEIKSEAPRNCYRYDTTWRGFMGPKNRYHPTTGTVLRAFLIPWSGFPPIEAPLVILLSDSCDNRHKQLGFGHLDHPPRSLARRQAFNALSSSYPWHALVNWVALWVHTHCGVSTAPSRSLVSGDSKLIFYLQCRLLAGQGFWMLEWQGAMCAGCFRVLHLERTIFFLSICLSVGVPWHSASTSDFFRVEGHCIRICHDCFGYSLSFLDTIYRFWTSYEFFWVLCYRALLANVLIIKFTKINNTGACSLITL